MGHWVLTEGRTVLSVWSGSDRNEPSVTRYSPSFIFEKTKATIIFVLGIVVSYSTSSSSSIMGKKNKGTPTTRQQPKSATATTADVSTATSVTTSSSSSSSSQSSSTSNNNSSWLFEFVNLSLVLPTITTYTLVTIWHPTSFFGQLLCCLILDSVYCAAIGTFVKPIISKIIIIISKTPTKLNSSSSSSSSVVDTLLHQSNDPSIVWPPADAKLPQHWRSFAEQKNRNNNKRRNQKDDDEPIFFLNHVRGITRFVQAMLRLAHGCGTILMVYVMITYINSNSNTSEKEEEESPWSNIGLDVSSSKSLYDLGYGFFVGSTIIIVLFVVEVMLGWIHIIGYFEVVDDHPTTKKEYSLFVNLLWDILFHIGVSFNEELSLRGWVLIHSSAFILSSTSNNSSSNDTDNTTTTTFSLLLYHPMIIASIFQAIFFASLHAQSPGATIVGLFNLVIGGTVAAINVLFTGGLWFNLGWHFGWNICMGHLLGLSTSGIPMSAKLISIVPHPLKSNLHGGRFGPEQSPLAPFAYLLGLVMLIYIYDGTQYGITIWNERLHNIY